MKKPRFEFPLVAFKSKLYACGGVVAKHGNIVECDSLLECYDPDLNTWKLKTSLNFLVLETHHQNPPMGKG